MEQKNQPTKEELEELSKTFKMYADRLLVKPFETEQTTKGGLIVPPNGQNEEQGAEGIVVAVSERILANEMECDKVAVGDRVCFSKFAGTPYPWKGENYKVMRMTDLMFGLEEPTKE